MPDNGFLEASRLWDAGEVREALRAFAELAHEGDAGAQLNLGYFYDRGLGTARDVSKAPYWYRRAYRAGHASAGNNIGTVDRDLGERTRAVAWFSRALVKGEIGSALELAKLYAQDDKVKIARFYLMKIRRSARVSEADKEEAERMLKELPRARTSPTRPKLRYSKHEGTALWETIDGAVAQLEANHDLALTTTREHVVGFLCEQVSTRHSARRNRSARLPKARHALKTG